MVNCVVVDDDQETRDVFCEILRTIGVEVLATGKHGKEAEKLYEKFRPDLIFIDLMMPKYDGFYAIERINNIDPKAKIVIVTGNLKAGESHLLNTYELEAIIYKPYDVDTIKQVVTDSFLI